MEHSSAPALSLSECFAAVLEAAQSLISPALSPAGAHGKTGSLAANSHTPCLLSDLRELLFPGLRSLGVAAEFFLFPAEDTGLIRVLRERLRYDVAVPVFMLHGEEMPARELPDVTGNAAWPEPAPDIFPVVIRRGTVTSVVMQSGGRILWRDAAGVAHAAAASELRTHFTHVLRLQQAGIKGGRREGTQNALLRWLAFSAACPDRCPTAKDVPTLDFASEFLQEIGAADKTPAGKYIRQAAQCYAKHAPETALSFFLEAALTGLLVPNATQNALLRPRSEPLPEWETRELIYLARAGTRFLKIFAARRLTAESENKSVRSTLQQLRYDPDCWVRAAAGLPLHTPER